MRSEFEPGIEAQSPVPTGREWPQETARPGELSQAGGAAVIVWGEWLLLLLLIGIFAWRGFLPGWRTLNTDFPNYYLTARLYRQGFPVDRVYDWIWFQRQKDHAAIEQRLVGFIPLTLLSAIPIMPLTSFPPLTAKRIWLVANVLLLAATLWLLYCITDLGARRVSLLAFLAIEPLRTNFLYGQFHILVLFLLTLALWLKARNSPASSGLAVALASGLKVYPALFFCYFLRKKQWNAATGLLIGGVFLGLLSLYLFGFEANRTYLRDVLPRIGFGENNDPYNVGWDSATALMHRLFIFEPGLNPRPLFSSTASYAVLQPFFQALIFVPFLWLVTATPEDAAREPLAWGAFAAMLLVLSTNSASYHYCVLILTSITAVNYLVNSGKRVAAFSLTLCYTFSCLPLQRLASHFSEGIAVFLAFPRLYGMVGVLGLLAFALASSRDRTAPFRSRESLAFAVIFLVLVTVGFLKTRRHLRGLIENYASRENISASFLLAGEPCVAQDRLFFTTLQRSSYVLASKVGLKIFDYDLGPDTFHPACSVSSADSWAEVAGKESQVVLLGSPGSATKSLRPPVEVENAEQPTVDQEGKRVAFIREALGRGGLWVKLLKPKGVETSPESAEQKLVDIQFDVLDVAFEPDSKTVIFCARPQGNMQLFSVDISTHQITALGLGNAVRYPAFSPDGQWLAFSRRSQGNWQLWVKNIESNNERRLTDGECNSVSPAWFDNSKIVVYATDCGRGLGLTALSAVTVTP